jgi:hypothetical protein
VHNLIDEHTRECVAIHVRHGFNSAQGFTMNEIASELDVSAKTAETHRGSLGRKLGNPNHAQLTCLALSHGLVTHALLAIRR